MSGLDLERAFIRPVLRMAEQHPMTFLELMLRQAAKTSEGIEMVGAVMHEMTELCHEQAGGLEGLLRLKQIVDGRGSGKQ